jgi:hypothetical protein
MSLGLDVGAYRLFLIATVIVATITLHLCSCDAIRRPGARSVDNAAVPRAWAST